jgi:hypothetical protein
MPRTCFNALPAALLLAALLLGSAVAAGPPADARNATLAAQVLDPEARIYAERDPFSAVLLSSAAGDMYAVRARTSGWYEVTLPDGRTGWIAEQHVVVGPARGSGAPRAHPGTEREALGALAGTLVGGTVTGALYVGAFLLADEPFEGLFEPVHGSGTVSQTTGFLALSAAAVSYVLTPAAAAYGAYTAGERDKPGGSMWTSWAYSTAGGILGSGLGIGLSALAFRDLGGGSIPFAALVGTFGTTAGAVLGYENSKRTQAQRYGWTQHVSPPTFGLTLDTSTRGQTFSKVRLNLVALRF